MKRQPPSRAEVERSSRERLAEMKSAGIKFVTILGCNCPPEECDAYRAIQNEKFEIEFAPTLPLLGCDKEFCKCIHLASS
jgi:hypothetical protein